MAAGDIIYASDFERPFCRLVQATSQTIGTSDTALTFGTGSEANDAWSLHDETTNNTRITVNKSGLWLVKGTVFVASNTSLTTLTATIGVNGGVIPARSRSKPAATAATMSQEVVEMVFISSGDYLELFGTCGGVSVSSNVGGSFASTLQAAFIAPQ